VLSGVSGSWTTYPAQMFRKFGNPWLKVAGSRTDDVNKFFYLIYLIVPAALGPAVHSASNKNEYQKHKNNVSGK
jgi:hypothetical protein